MSNVKDLPVYILTPGEGIEKRHVGWAKVDEQNEKRLRIDFFENFSMERTLLYQTSIYPDEVTISTFGKNFCLCGKVPYAHLYDDKPCPPERVTWGDVLAAVD